MLVCVLLLALVAGVSILYLRQASRLRWRWRMVLLILRLGPLAVLSLAILKPTLLRDAKPSERGAVVIVVDHSSDMALRDTRRRPGQLVALADGLGLIPSSARASGDKWIAAAGELSARLADVADAQSRVSFAQISGLSTEAPESELGGALQRFETAMSALNDRKNLPEPGPTLGKAIASLREAFAQPRGADVGETWLPQVQAAVETVSEAAGTYQFDSDERLYESDPAVKSVCNSLAKKNRLELIETALVEHRSGLLQRLPPRTTVYGFAAAEKVAPLPLYGRNDAPIRHLLLQPQGSGVPSESAVRDALDDLHGAAVRAVVLFSNGRAPSASAAAVGTPNVPVFAISSAPMPGAHEPVLRDVSISSLSLPKAVYAGQRFSITAQIKSFGFPASAAQPVRCEVADGLMSKAVTLPRNGSVDVSFDVTASDSGLMRVKLWLPDLPGEVNFANNVAEGCVKVLPRKIGVSLEADAPVWDWRLAREAFAKNGDFEVRTFDAGPKSDALIMFDAFASELDARRLQALKAFVENGGLLVLAAGPDHSPAAWLRSPAESLLPFHPAESLNWTVWRGSEPAYHFSRGDAANGDLDPFSLPPVFQYVAPDALKPTARPLLVEVENHLPVIAEIPLGAGHVIYIGICETWRWRYARAGERFWTDLVKQWSEPPYGVSDGVASFDVAQPVVGPGDSIDLRAKIEAANGPASVAVSVSRDGKEIRKDNLPLVSPGHYAGQIAPLQVGDYVLQLDTGKSRVGYPLHVAASRDSLLQDPVAARDALRRLTDDTGGRLLSLDQMEQLPKLIAETPAVQTVPVTLWDSSYLFVFVVACFSAEWALRKKMGLA